MIKTTPSLLPTKLQAQQTRPPTSTVVNGRSMIQMRPSPTLNVATSVPARMPTPIKRGDNENDDDEEDEDDDEGDEGQISCGVGNEVGGGFNMLLKNTIQHWVRNDNEIRALNMELAKRKKLKKQYTDKLIQQIKKTEIETVDIKDGYISCITKSQKKPITQKFLYDILNKYYKGDIEKTENVNNFIKDNREITNKDVIIRKIY